MMSAWSGVRLMSIRSKGPSSMMSGRCSRVTWPISGQFCCVGVPVSPETELARRAVPPSSLSLLGLLRHVAKVERRWFRERFAGENLDPLYDPALGADADFDDLDPARASTDYARLLDEFRRADAAVAGASLDDTFPLDGEECSLRFVYLHMIGEYARHNGHADLLRERIDGVTGP